MTGHFVGTIDVAQIDQDRLRHVLLQAGEVERAVGGSAAGKTIAVLGLSFKPETDDMRDAPSLDIIRELQARGASIRAYDPVAMPNASRELSGVVLCENAYETCENADALVLVTEWNQFRMLDIERVKKLLREPVLVDLRNVYDPHRMAALGFRYTSVGRVDDRRTRPR